MYYVLALSHTILQQTYVHFHRAFFQEVHLVDHMILILFNKNIVQEGMLQVKIQLTPKNSVENITRTFQEVPLLKTND